MILLKIRQEGNIRLEKLKYYSESFKFKFEKFLIGCDSIEEMGLWSFEENGKMGAFYTADLISIIIRLIAADGNITQKEVDYLNENFGFEYTTEELTAIYEDCSEAIDAMFDEGAKNGLTLMRSINEKLADAYIDLIVTICDIIIESDGVIDAAEIELAKRIKEWGA